MVTLLKREDIAEGIYLKLKQITERYGTPVGLLAVVHKVGTDWTGEMVLSTAGTRAFLEVRNNVVRRQEASTKTNRIRRVDLSPS